LFTSENQSLLIRWNTFFVLNLLFNIVDTISRFNFKTPPTVAAELLSAAPSPSTLAAIEKGVQGSEATPSILATLVLGSPDFQRR